MKHWLYWYTSGIVTGTLITIITFEIVKVVAFNRWEKREKERLLEKGKEKRLDDPYRI